MRARLGLLLLLALLATAVAPPSEAEARPPGPKVAGKLGILVDTGTGDVL